MAWSSRLVVSISLVTLTLVTSSTGCLLCRLCEELKCLDVPVEERCDLEVTPAGSTSVPFRCNQMLVPEQVSPLATTPRLVMPKTGSLELPISILIVLYDIDAPEKPDEKDDGWFHWVATGTLEVDGVVTVFETVKGKKYHGLNPPPGPPHRYQFMIFEYDGQADDVIINDGRVDKLCRFIENNRLQQPLAASQIRFQN